MLVCLVSCKGSKPTFSRLSGFTFFFNIKITNLEDLANRQAMAIRQSIITILIPSSGVILIHVVYQKFLDHSKAVNTA